MVFLENIEDVKLALSENTKMVFITAGMGGGTGKITEVILQASEKAHAEVSAEPEPLLTEPVDASDALLEHGRRGIHDTGVDIALDLEVEQVRTVLSILEGVGGGLVDRDRGRAGGGFGFVSVVQGQRFEFHGVGPSSK